MLKVRADVRKDKEVRGKPSAVIVHNQHRAAQYNMLPIDVGFFLPIWTIDAGLLVFAVSGIHCLHVLKHKLKFEGRLLTCAISLRMTDKKVAVH